MKLKIHNIRLGHATNSSSSHSIVIAPPNFKNLPSTHDHRSGDLTFGWEQFILADPESKSEYFAAQLFMSLTHEGSLSNEMAAAVIRDWLKVDVGDVSEKYPNISVDHQSALRFPSSSLTKDFAEQLRNFISDDRVIVYGGNDNGGDMEIPNEFQEIEFFDMITDVSTGKMILKQDGRYWIFYNSSTGNKIRFSFDVDDMEANAYTKSTTPELVDLKITDYCPFGCSFCYQSSTRKGHHAEIGIINQIITHLSDMKVFELAIGGGEPTMHPDFAGILEYCHKENIIPNFTTYSMKWLKDKSLVKAVKKYAGGIGVSIHSVKDLNKIYDIAEVVNGDKNRVGGYWHDNTVSIMGQHVIGTHPIDETMNIIAEAWNHDIPMLLLGYKDVGFGLGNTAYDMTGIEMALKLVLEEKQKYHNVSLSVDTAMLELYPDLVKILGINKVLTSSQEGKFSMYIDAVQDRMAKSSYVADDEYVTLSAKNEWNHACINKKHIIEEYAKW